MSMINIRETTDTFERYKMPKLVAKIEGKGNGIKTVIVNMVDIARALKRPAIYPTKFFGCELGAQIQVDSKNSRYIVNGAHTAERLQELLFAFIKKYVLCIACGNPETNLQVKKQNIIATCIACGNAGTIDSIGRFSQFLIKHPPDQDSPVPTKKGRKKKKDKEKSTNGNENGNENGNHDSGDHDDDNDFDDDDEDWYEETEEERQKREEDMSNHLKNMIITNEMDKSPEERLDIFYKFCQNMKEQGTINVESKKVYERAEALSVKDKAPLLLMDLLVSLKTFQKDIDDNINLLRLVIYFFVIFTVMHIHFPL